MFFKDSRPRSRRAPYARRRNKPPRAPGGVLFIFIAICLVVGGLTLGRGRVVKLSDGDSFTVLSRSTKLQEIRLYGIDSPELKQRGGPEAKDFASDLIFLQEVSITPLYQDPYERTVAVVNLPDGRNLNEEMLRGGHAWVEPRYCKEIWCASWKKLETEARRKRLGLWAEKNPTPPWIWRKLR